MTDEQMKNAINNRTALYLPKLSCDWQSTIPEFVAFWSACYHDKREPLYADRIYNAKFENEDIQNLFEWKNGGNLSKRKQSTLNKIIGKRDVINELKTNFDLCRFKESFAFMHDAVIWKIFLLHIINSIEYPIFDQHAYRAYLFLTQGKLNEIPEIPSNNKEKEQTYFDAYLGFFNELSKPNIDRKKLDEALWVFGKFLKSDWKAIVT